MKSINQYINEKLIISNTSFKRKYNYFPQTKEELKDLINQLIEERGNEGDFNGIDISEITDMSKLFYEMNDFNGNISNWDVSKVTDMRAMFKGCKKFNQPLDDWDVSNVTDMDWMFRECHSFNQNISNWDTAKVNKFSHYCMFACCPIEEKYKPKFLDDDGNPSNIYIDDISAVGEKSIKLSTDNDRKSITFRMPEDFEDFIICLGTGDKETGEKLYTGLYSEIE
jgi:surface protein